MTKASILLLVVPTIMLCQVRGTGVSNYNFSGANAVSVTLPPWNVLAGGTIVGCIRYSDPSNVTISVSDSGSVNRFTVTNSAIVNGGNQLAMFKAENTVAASNDIVTITFSAAAAYTSEAAVQYSGTAASAFDAGAAAASNAAGPFTTTQGPETVVVCGTESYQGGPITPGTLSTSPQTSMNTAAVSADLLIADANLYQIQTNIDANYTYSDSGGTYGIVVGTFKSSHTTSPPVLTEAFSNYTASTYPNAPYIYAGGSASVVFTITNPNASGSLSGIGFSDALPPGMVVATPPAISGSCPGGTISAVAAGDIISLAGAALSGAGACTFSVNVVSTAAGTGTNTTGPISATESGAGEGGTATATLSMYGGPSISISSIAVNAIQHSGVQLTYSLSHSGYCQMQFGLSSGNYIYATGSAPSYANTPGGSVQGCQLAIGGLKANTRYYIMPAARPDANDTVGICYTGGSCGTSEQTFTTLPLPNPHPAPPVPPVVWTPTEPDTSSYTVVSMQADPVTSFCVAAANVAKQTNWSSAVAAGDSFQTVLNEIWFDTVIEFASGSSCIVPSVGPDIIGVSLPPYSPVGGPNDWVMIRTHANSASDLPPFGVRTGPQFASKLATLVAQIPNNRTSVQNTQGQLFNCYATDCNHFWMENIGWTHQFNSTVYPPGVADPPAFGPYISITTADASTGFQTGLNLRGTTSTPITIPSVTPAAVTFTTQVGLGYAAGTVIQMVNQAGDIMQGVVVSYNSSTGAAVASIEYAVGSGTYSSWSLIPPANHIVLDRVYAYPQPWPSREMNCFVMGGNYWAIMNSYCAVNFWVEGVYPQENPVDSASSGAVIDIPNVYFQFNAYDETPIGMTTAAGFAGTSTTVLALTTGPQAFSTNIGLSYTAGNLIELFNSGSCGNYGFFMMGTVTSYDASSGSMVANITGVVGSGTCASWSLVTPAVATVSGASLSSYSGAVYAWIGSTGLTIEYQAAPGITMNCIGCTATAVTTPARADVPATSMYYFNGYFSAGTFVLQGSAPENETPSILSSFRPLGLYFYPGQYTVYDNNYMQAIGQTVYNDTYGLFQDMSWTHSYFYFPRSKMQNSGQWDGYGYSFRNIIESKQQVRGAYIGNIIDGAASYENPGNAFIVGGAYQSIYWSFGASDLNITANVMKHLSSAVQGGPASPPNAPTLVRFAVTNNLILDLNRDLYNFGGGGLDSGPFVSYPMAQDVTISNNTVGLTKGNGPAVFLFGAADSGTSVMGEGLQFTNNVLMTSLGGLDVFFSADGGQRAPYSNFLINPVVPVSVTPTATTWAEYFNGNWIQTGASVNPSVKIGNNVVVGAQCNTRGGSQCNSSGTGPTSWVDLTQSQVTNYIANLWNPNLDTTSVFPNPSAGTMASRIAAIGWSPSMNLAGGNPNPYAIVPTVYNPGNLGANVTTVNQAAGIVQGISFLAGPSSLQFNYTAPDSRACSIDISADDSAWTRLADNGGGFLRSLTFTGLTAGTAYYYRILCYFDQSATYEFLPSQITSGTASTPANFARTIFQEFTLPSGASQAVFAFFPINGPAVNQTCATSPCSVSLGTGNWTRVLTYETTAAVPIGSPSTTNIVVE
jgi:hypothetical protein